MSLGYAMEMKPLNRSLTGWASQGRHCTAGKIGDDLLEPGTLILQSLQSAHLIGQQTRILLALIEMLIPAFRQISATGTPSSPCFKINAFWASEPKDREAKTSMPSSVRSFSQLGTYRGKLQL